MSFSYSLFGLSLEADRPLPALVALSATPGADVRLWWGGLGSLPLPSEQDRRRWYTSPSGDGRPALRVWELKHRVGE